MKHLIILCSVLLCAMLLLLSLSASAQTDTIPVAVPDTTTLSATGFKMPTLPEGYVHEDDFPDNFPVYVIAFAVILLVVTVYFFVTLQKVPSREHLRRKAYKKAGKEPRQVSLTITCDEGYTADFLRELATVIEDRNDDDSSPDFEYETFHGYAEITTED